MDLWSALGISRETGLIAAGVGLVAAALIAAANLVLRRRRDPGLGLDDR